MDECDRVDPGDLVACIKAERSLSAQQMSQASCSLEELATNARSTQSLQTTESRDLKAGVAKLTYLEPTASTTTNLVSGALLIEKAMADPLTETTIIVPNDGCKLNGDAFVRICTAFQ